MAWSCCNDTLKIKINDEYAKLIPEISQSDYDSFKPSIKENGHFVPILVNKHGIILDGYYIYKPCQPHELPIRSLDILLIHYNSGMLY